MNILALFCGLLFGFGVLISGMTNPVKVLAFLDVSGPWDPSLVLVMVSAVLVATPFFRSAGRRSHAVLGDPIRFPPRHGITRPLLLGSLIFGIGWGINGLCPGPAIATLGGGTWQDALFFTSLLFGMRVHTVWQQRKAQPAAVEPAPAPSAGS